MSQSLKKIHEILQNHYKIEKPWKYNTVKQKSRENTMIVKNFDKKSLDKSTSNEISLPKELKLIFSNLHRKEIKVSYEIKQL